MATTNEQLKKLYDSIKALKQRELNNLLKTLKTVIKGVPVQDANEFLNSDEGKNFLDLYASEFRAQVEAFNTKKLNNSTTNKKNEAPTEPQTNSNLNDTNTQTFPSVANDDDY